MGNMQNSTHTHTPLFSSVFDNTLIGLLSNSSANNVTRVKTQIMIKLVSIIFRFILIVYESGVGLVSRSRL
jgi:hypothetical protein